MTAKRFKFNGRNNCIEYDGKSILLDSYGEDIEELLNELHEENEQLRHDATILIQSNQDYRKENEQLKQRNDRQAKQLDRLYNLIEQKDWRTLNDILDDFKRCEEQLQREWRTYK